MTRLDPRLQQALDDSSGGNLLEVVVRFGIQPSSPIAGAQESLASQRRKAADAVSKDIESLVSRIAAETGEDPSDISLFPALSSAYVRASPRFLRALLEDEDVLGAMLNESR